MSQDRRKIARRRFLGRATLGIAGTLAGQVFGQGQQGANPAPTPPATRPAPRPKQKPKPRQPAPDFAMRLLCWESAVDQSLIDRFKTKIRDERGISVEIEVIYAQENTQFFRGAMLRSYDLITPAQEELKAGRFRYIDRGLCVPIDVNKTPNHQRLNRCLAHLNTAWDGDQLMAMPMLAGQLGLAYRVFAGEPAPLSWKALWEPKFRGRFSVSKDGALGNVFVAALSAGLRPHEFGNPDRLTEAGVPDLLTYLALNAKTMWQRVDTSEDLKECYIGASRGGALPGLAKMDQIWEMAKPEEGAPGWVDLWMMTKRVLKPGRKEIAEAWIDFYLSPEVQLNRLRATRSLPVIEGLTDYGATSDEALQFRLGDPEYFVNSFVISPSVNERTDRAMREMWYSALEDAGRI